MANIIQDSSSYKFDFYSGSQITVWFGNIMLDDISSIQWVRTQNKVPIYGYASQLFDSVANGTVIVQGNFTINFRQRGYLNKIIDSIKYLYKSIAPNDPDKVEEFDKAQWPAAMDMISSHLRNGTFGPQTMGQIQELGKSENFAETVKMYQSILWDDQDGKKSRPTGVDMSQTVNIPGGFNIQIAYGSVDGEEARTISAKTKSTTKMINGVHLIGESQMIQVGGQPVQEQYSFIARNTDEGIGSSR